MYEITLKLCFISSIYYFIVTVVIFWNLHIVFQVTLAQRQGTYYDDIDNGKAWDIIEFPEVISSHTVKILATSAYTTHNNGFVEVEFYGTECKCNV